MFRFFILFFSFVFFGCSPAERPADTGGEESATASAMAEEDTGPDLYQQYLWCKQGENYSDESSQAQTARWIELAVEAGVTNWGAFTLIPRVEDPNFDSILGLMWPSKEAQEADMALYAQAGVNAKLSEEFPGVALCGGDEGQWTWGFDTWNSDRTAAQQSSEPGATGVGSYHFCSYNEGKEPSDLVAVVEGPHASWIEEFEKENGPSSYSFKYFRPDFDTTTAERNDPVPAEYDFVWLDAHNSEEDRVAGQNSFEATGQEVQAAFDEVATCNTPQVFDFTLVRAIP